MVEAQAQINVNTPESFKDLLEKSGVANQIAKLLIDLFEKPEKAEDAANFVKTRFEVDTEVNIEELIISMDLVKDENAALQREIEELQKELEALRGSE